MSTLISYTENGGGSTRVYSGGSIFTSSAGSFAVTGLIRTAYFAKNGAWGDLGWPTSAATCTSSGCSQGFQHGAIMTSATAAYTFDSAEYAAYLAAGGSSVLGQPTSGPLTYTQNGGGTTWVFDKGSLFTSVAGTFAVTEPIRTPYFAQQGAWGVLGWPTKAMSCANNICSQEFQGGTLSSTGSVTSPPSGGSTPDVTLYSGRIPSVASQNKLGAPTSDVLVYTQNGGGVARVYGAATVFSSAAGAFVVSGAIRTQYFTLQGAWGDLGWPVAAQQCITGGCSQTFQNGAVYSTSSGAVSILGAEYATYNGLGGPTGSLGLPTSGLYNYTQNGGGTARVFQRGSLFTSTAGSFAVTEPIRTA